MQKDDKANSQVMLGLNSWLQKGLAAICIALLSPFALLNFINGNLSVGIGVSAVVVLFVLVIWRQGHHGFFNPNFFLLMLVPVVTFFIAVATVESGVRASLWCYPTILMYYFLLPQRLAWIANAGLVVVFIPLSIYCFPPQLAYRFIVTLVLVSILPAVFVNVIERLQLQLRNLATRDSLTGLLNRTPLAESLEYAIEEHKRLELPMSVVALDVDHFKKINDQLGHDGGDAVLVDIGKVLDQRCRKVDKAFRLGGEEFLLLLHGANGHNAVKIADQIRSSVACLKTHPDFQVTISAGVATLKAGEEYSAWMKRADVYLYQAKARGRDQTGCDLDTQEQLF